MSLRHFERQTHQIKTSFAFWFAEGSLVRALKEGHWLLLDEINLVRAVVSISQASAAIDIARFESWRREKLKTLIAHFRHDQMDVHHP